MTVSTEPEAPAEVPEILRKSPPPLTPPHPPHGLGALPAGRWFLLVGAALALAFAASISVTLMSMNETRAARAELVNVLDPMILHTLQMSTAMAAEESSMRGWGRTNEQPFLDRYNATLQEESTAKARLARLVPSQPGLGDEVRRLETAITVWRRDYAEAVMAAVPTLKKQTATQYAEVNSERFGEVQGALHSLQQSLTRLHDASTQRLDRGWDIFYLAMASLAIVLLVSTVALTLLVRLVVLRPVARLTAQVRDVAAGDFDRQLSVPYPAEMSELAGHVDGMRRRVVSEWRKSALAQQALLDQAAELKRSNGELEQFAYVASHDLQEPLRKVASFTQMLDQRYSDQLDDRARQYIKFAVDGAKRMQSLINDLLDFSRVGRVSAEREPVSAQTAFDVAVSNLAARIEDAEAVVTHDDLPMLNGNHLLLTQLFQNLIGNAIKFRSTEAPRIHVSAQRSGDLWEFAVADNGIGVDLKYADRIFLIFQRLHPRDVYPGTGIGLALCRKIVEFHGGRIWLDDQPEGTGTTFRFTLEAAPQEEAE